MPRSLIYELNTRCWLGELSRREGRDIGLDSVPDSEFAEWQRSGFTHLWLMGVWTTGPRTRACYLDLPDTRRHLSEVLPDWSELDVPGSPYAVAAYRVPERLGGEVGLRAFRERLHQEGMQLILDFVPNHLGLDHPWIFERPELFVQAPADSPDATRFETRYGPRWLRQGKDPYFPAWIDTVQLDHRRADTRQAIIDELRSVAERCDGVRCDMAMLLLKEVFDRTWSDAPPVGALAVGEFWSDAIRTAGRPGFLWLAEAYWDLEERLQELGFAMTYDKRVTDFIVDRRPTELQRHLLGKSMAFRRRCVHFLENHDEPRVAGRLSMEEHRAAALLVLSLPGVCLLHEGQLTGARVRASVHLARRPKESLDSAISSLYRELLDALLQTAVGHGEGAVLKAESVGAEDVTPRQLVQLVVLFWPADGLAFDLVVVNLSPENISARVELPASFSSAGFGGGLTRSDWFGGSSCHAKITAIDTGLGLGLIMSVPAFGAHGLRFTPAD